MKYWVIFENVAPWLTPGKLYELHEDGDKSIDDDGDMFNLYPIDDDEAILEIP